MEIVTFGQIMKDLRIEAGLTQSALGRMIGSTQQAVARWENQSGIPSRRNIILIADALDVTPGYFLDEVNNLTDKEINEIKKADDLQKKQAKQNPPYIDYGRFIKESRCKADITQQELAEKTGLSLRDIQQYELGKKEPIMSDMMSISEATHAPDILAYYYDNLLDDKDDEAQDEIDKILEHREQDPYRNYGGDIYEANVKVNKKFFFEKDLPLYRHYKKLIPTIEKNLITSNDETLQHELEDLKRSLRIHIASMLGTEIDFFEPSAYIEIQEVIDKILENPAYTTAEYKELLKQSENKTE